MSTRMTNRLKIHIRDAIREDIFKGPREKLWEQRCSIAEQVYAEIVPDPEVLMRVPDGILWENDNIVCSIDGEYFRGDLAIKRRLPVALYSNNRVTRAAITNSCIVRDFQAMKTFGQKLRKDDRTLCDTLDNIFSRTTTVKAFIKSYPEFEKFVPKDTRPFDIVEQEKKAKEIIKEYS